MSADMPISTAPTSEWQPMSSAPTGAKCLLLTHFGVAVVGVASGGGYIAWAPLPQRPDWLRVAPGNAPSRVGSRA